MHPGAYIDQPVRSFDQCGQNVGREDIDSKDGRNAGLRLHPPLAITDTRIVDYRVEAPELVDLVGNGSCSRDGGEVAGNNSARAGCRRERVATSALVSPVQYDLMALLDQEPGRHEAEPVRRSRYEYASHRRTSSCRAIRPTIPNGFPAPRARPLRSVLGILTND